MGSLTQHQTIIWREMMATVNNGYSPTIYIATAKRRAALVAVNARLEELEALAKRIANTDPVHRFGCTFCGSYCLDTPHVHAYDCIWLTAKELSKWPQ